MSSSQDHRLRLSCSTNSSSDDGTCEINTPTTTTTAVHAIIPVSNYNGSADDPVFTSVNCMSQEVDITALNVDFMPERRIIETHSETKPLIHSSNFPSDHDSPVNLTSNTLTFMQLIKANIGTGILAIPNAFANSGLILGTVALPILGFIAIHCMHLLVNSHNKICNILGYRALDYQEVAEKALQLGPRCLRSKAIWARRAVVLFLIITQLGFCCVYSLFVASNLSIVIRVLFGYHLRVELLLIIELPVMILFNLIRNWKHLAIISTIANILQTSGLIFVFYDLCQNLPPISSRPAINDVEKLPLYFGIAIYAFEGIGLVLPLRKEMRHPSALGGFAGILNLGMGVVLCLYTGIGFFGFLKYGPGVQGSITMSWPPEKKYAIVQLMFTIAIFLSYAVQFYVPINIMWPYFATKYELVSGERKTILLDTVLRTLLISLTFLIARLVPELDTVISLVGALSGSCLALIFPPLIDIIVNWDNPFTAKWTLIVIKDAAISLFGILGFLTGTYASTLQILKKT